ncbi:PREDICTED: uncharacterized protein LOC108364971 [Rhagoletis zephyria]|uniref:uncharacterized protein LOC108364971 n=1 Tax=Rhagoletis zephyria TaxID=28612 RepID=UPI0008115FFB|nr:PREDICTED: uncharacterized protein LOC108364971 [Rhagoletis zephyria]XP_036342396.1 uncharacterized protein LOC118751690 [Rhagoletis pomonella]
MDNSSKKVFKKTSSAQFDVLVKELEKNPDLAKGAPMFGASKSLVELQWNELANKLNAHGPPQRTATEWKRFGLILKAAQRRKLRKMRPACMPQVVDHSGFRPDLAGVKSGHTKWYSSRCKASGCTLRTRA